MGLNPTDVRQARAGAPEVTTTAWFSSSEFDETASGFADCRCTRVLQVPPSMQNSTRRWSWWIVGVVVLGTGCQGFSFGQGGGGGGADCLPQGPALCGPYWDADGDTISTNTEQNLANKTAYGGFYNFDVTKWDLNLSQARGDPRTTGTLFMGMNLADYGQGYVHHNGTDPVDSDDWGTNHLLRLIESVGRDWGNLAPREQPGDMSLKTGGEFCWTNSSGQRQCHDLHRRGLDVDVRYLRNDNFEIPLNICEDPPDPNNKYNITLTRDLLETFLAMGNGEDGKPRIVEIYVDKAALGLEHPLFIDAAGHCDHFHVRIADPDGIN